MSDFHVTAMLEEAVDMLACRPGKTIVDGTLGGFENMLSVRTTL